jgi:hypothetical protein
MTPLPRLQFRGTNSSCMWSENTVPLFHKVWPSAKEAPALTEEQLGDRRADVKAAKKTEYRYLAYAGSQTTIRRSYNTTRSH